MGSTDRFFSKLLICLRVSERRGFSTEAKALALDKTTNSSIVTRRQRVGE